MTIRRQLPRGNDTRKTAITAAKAKLENPGPIGSVLTANTTARLNTIHATYLPAMTLINQRESEAQTATNAKNPFLQTLKLFCKSFIGTFNFGVERGKYPANHRPYYGIDGNNSNLPDLSREEEITSLATSIITGDPLRVAAGGAAMANPSAAEVGAKNTALLPLLAASSNAKDALDIAQEAVERMNVEADKVIKKVWDEVETFFNEEAPASKRANAREWGVVYVSDGADTPLTTVITLLSDQTIPGMVRIDYTGNVLATGGQQIIETWETGAFNISVPAPGIHSIFEWRYTNPGIKEPTTTGNIETIGEIRIPNNKLIRFTAEGRNNVIHFDGSGNAFDSPGTNNILLWLDGNGKLNGFVDLSAGTNAPPTGDGITAKNSLIVKGWTVITN